MKLVELCSGGTCGSLKTGITWVGNRIMIWDDSMKKISEFTCDDVVMDVACYGAMIVCVGGECVTIWNGGDKKNVLGVRGYHVGFSKDGGEFFVNAGDGVYVYDASVYGRRYCVSVLNGEISEDGLKYKIGVDDGKMFGRPLWVGDMLVTVCLVRDHNANTQVSFWNNSVVVKTIDIACGSMMCDPKRMLFSNVRVLFSADGRYMMTAYYDNGKICYRLRCMDEDNNPMCIDCVGYNVCVDMNDKEIVVGNGGCCEVYDIASGGCVRKLDAKLGNVEVVRFGDGCVVAGYEGGKLVVWKNGKMGQVIESGGGGVMYDIVVDKEWIVVEYGFRCVAVRI